MPITLCIAGTGGAKLDELPDANFMEKEMKGSRSYGNFSIQWIEHTVSHGFIEMKIKNNRLSTDIISIH